MINTLKELCEDFFGHFKNPKLMKKFWIYAGLIFAAIGYKTYIHALFLPSGFCVVAVFLCLFGILLNS
jgi:hypothetical protein